MKEIRLFMDQYMFLANSLLFLCYLQSNLLMFRLLFLAACLFLLIFTLSGDIISIDTLIFNILFVLINIYLAVPLIKNLAPPKFSHEQKEIFKHHFRGYLTPIEANVLLSSHRRKIFRVSSPIVKKGNEFESMFFIAKVGKNCTVELKSNKRVFELSENSWIGIPEYLNAISRKDSLTRALKEFDTGEWGLTMNVVMGEELERDKDISTGEVDTSNISGIGDNLSRDFSKLDEENVVVIYEFELASLDKVFNDHIHGISIMRGLHSIWMQYCSNIVKRVDQSNVAANSVQNPPSFATKRHYLPSLKRSYTGGHFTHNKASRSFDEPRFSNQESPDRLRGSLEILSNI